MTKIRGKILSLFLAVTLLLGLTPMMTYAAETTNQETNNIPGTSSRETTVLDAGEITVTTYPSAMKIALTSDKMLVYEVKTENGTSVRKGGLMVELVV